jgi:hypothetical protein
MQPSAASNLLNLENVKKKKEEDIFIHIWLVFEPEALIVAA